MELSGMLKRYKNLCMRSRNASSDSSSWYYSGIAADVFARMCFAVATRMGKKDLPPSPDTSRLCLMDAEAAIEEWGESLLADHKHRWEDCHHDISTNNLASHSKCNIGKWKGGGLYHFVCRICGKDRYDYSETVRKIEKEVQHEVAE